MAAWNSHSRRTYRPHSNYPTATSELPATQEEGSSDVNLARFDSPAVSGGAE